MLAGTMDWRGWVIVGVAIACIVATYFVWNAGYGHDPITPFGAIFAAWIAGLALFVITGILVALVSGATRAGVIRCASQNSRRALLAAASSASSERPHP